MSETGYLFRDGKFTAVKFKFKPHNHIIMDMIRHKRRLLIEVGNNGSCLLAMGDNLINLTGKQFSKLQELKRGMRKIKK